MRPLFFGAQQPFDGGHANGSCLRAKASDPSHLSLRRWLLSFNNLLARKDGTAGVGLGVKTGDSSEEEKCSKYLAFFENGLKVRF